MKVVVPTAKDMRQIFFKQQRRKNLIPEHAVLTTHLNVEIESIREAITAEADHQAKAGLSATMSQLLLEKKEVEDQFFTSQAERVMDYILDQPARVRLSKGNHQDREITTLNKRRPTLTLVDRYVALTLERVFEIRSVGRDHVIRNVLNAFRITQGSAAANRTILKIDIKDCFKNVDHEELLRKLSSHAGVPRFVMRHVRNVLEAYTRVYGERKGLPQGVPSSSVLAEIYFERLDGRMRMHPGIVMFVRYVDDMLIVCHGSENPAVISALDKELDNLSLQKNWGPGKSLVVSHPSSQESEITYLGYRFLFSAGTGQLCGVDISDMKYQRYAKALDNLYVFSQTGCCWSSEEHVGLFLNSFNYLVYPHYSKSHEDAPRIVTGLAYSARYALHGYGSMQNLDQIFKEVFHRFRPVLGKLLKSDPQKALCPCCNAPVARTQELDEIRNKKRIGAEDFLRRESAREHPDEQSREQVRKLLWN